MKLKISITTELIEFSVHQGNLHIGLAILVLKSKSWNGLKLFFILSFPTLSNKEHLDASMYYRVDTPTYFSFYRLGI